MKMTLSDGRSAVQFEIIKIQESTQDVLYVYQVRVTANGAVETIDYRDYWRARAHIYELALNHTMSHSKLLRVDYSDHRDES